MPEKKSDFSHADLEEHKRLSEHSGESNTPTWLRWGPYVAERAWGTVREDYSPNGDAWNYFPFDQAKYKAYRWGEDAIAGWCDRYQLLVFAPVFWNGKDPILKERLFGLSSTEGNHGEDVKEYYFHLDGTPSHSYMKYLYKYPQARFPYEQLKEKNQQRSIQEKEYELMDTGIFQDNRYFDIFIEYAKVSPEDVIIKIQAFNRFTQSASLHILPHLWFRNRWSWADQKMNKPEIVRGPSTSHTDSFLAQDETTPSLSNLPFVYQLGKRSLYGPKGAELLFTDNETAPIEKGAYENHYKDGFHQSIIEGKKLTAAEKGTKGCLHYHFSEVPAGQSITLYLRLSDQILKDPLEGAEEYVQLRKKEADDFYSTVHPSELSAEEKMIQRQALADLCWSKQIYLYDISLWLDGDNKKYPPSVSRMHIRNYHWRHLNSMRILSMPDKWEYPWFAAWDLAFHCVTWALIDIDFAKEQMWLLLFDQFQHPNGQIPAYEWEFSDLNPPIQAWAVLKIYQMEKERTGKTDLVFFEKCFHKLLMNFSWWVNKVDSSGNNVFEGGFLGLDNIAVLDRSARLPHGAVLQQSDGTGWMAFFCLNLMRMSMELSLSNKVYESLATKFFEHYVYIAHAMKRRGDRDYSLWNEEDGFFYDVLTYPDGKYSQFKVRSLVGIIPLFAVDFITEEELKQYPDFHENFHWFLKNRLDLIENSVITQSDGGRMTYILTPMNQHQLKSILQYIWNPEEFRSPFGLRSLSKFHEKHPFEFEGKRVSFEPAESLEKIKGGNSNWRGPIWLPTSYLLIEALQKLYAALKEDLHIQYGQEKPVNLNEMALSFSDRLLSIFKENKEGRRPFHDASSAFATDPFWKDYLLFNEYFHAEQGKGLGASHQCGWTALIANVLDERPHMDHPK